MRKHWRTICGCVEVVQALASFVKRPLVIDRSLSNEGAQPDFTKVGLIGAGLGCRGCARWQSSIGAGCAALAA